MPHHPLSGPYVEDPSVRETYVDSFELRVDLAGVLRIDLCAQRWNPDNADAIGHRVPVARIAMSVPLATALRDAITRETGKHTT